MLTFFDDGHEIAVDTAPFTGFEKVYLNKELVSKKWAPGGTLHLFDVGTGENKVRYEVEIGLRWHWLGTYVTARKDGQVIFTNK